MIKHITTHLYNQKFLVYTINAGTTRDTIKKYLN